ncbi:hypothetical protein ES703_124019 [subsurface metagenome]
MLSKITHSVEAFGFKAQLVEFADQLVNLVVERALHLDALAGERVKKACFGRGLPPRQKIDFVRDKHEGSFVRFQNRQRFKRLGHETFVDVDDQSSEVGERPSAAAQVGKGLVPGSVNEEQPGKSHLYFELLEKSTTNLFDGFRWDFGRPYVLRNST